MKRTGQPEKKPRGFGSLPKGKYDSGLTKFEQALIAAGRDPADIIELLDTDEDYRNRLAEFASRGDVEVPIDHRLARAVMSTNFFGIEEWTSLYGVTLPDKKLRTVAKFPWDKEVLAGVCPFYPKKKIHETHFAFLGMKVIGSAPLTINHLQTIHPADGQPRFSSYPPDSWFTSHNFAVKITCELRWYLALKEVVPGSTSKWWNDQLAMLPPEYEPPTGIMEVTKDLMCYKKHQVYPNQDVYARCDSLTTNDNRVDVGDCNPSGVDVSGWNDEPRSYIGIGAFRKLPGT